MPISWRRVASIALLAAVACSAQAAALPPDVPDPGQQDVENVASAALAGDRLIVGGSFASAGDATGGAAVVDTTSGALLATLPFARAQIDSITRDGLGGWYVGGFFTSAGGQPHSRIVHVLPGGAVDPGFTTPPITGTVLALALSGGKLYAGGVFGGVDGNGALRRLARFDPATGAVDPTFAPAPNDSVRALVATASTLWVGGDFQGAGAIAGANRDSIAGLDLPAGTVNAAFAGVATSSRVDDLALAGATVYACGGFATFAGTARTDLAAFDATTGAVSSWAPATSTGSCSALATDGSAVYAGGSLTVAAPARANLAAFDAATGTTLSWNPAPDSFVTDVSVSGGVVAVAGQFTTAGGTPRAGFALLHDALGGGAASALPAVGAAGDAEVSGGRVLTDAILANPVARPGLASFDLAGHVEPPLPQPAPFGPSSLAAGGGRVWLAGAFTTVGGQPRQHLAAVDLATRTVAPFQADTAGFANALVVSRDATKLYVGGSFSPATPIGGVARSRFAVLDAASGSVLPPDLQVASAVLAMVLSPDGRTLYVGGTFDGATSFGGQPRSFLAAVDTTTDTVTSWAPHPNSAVRSLAISPDGRTVYAAGDFATVDGAPRNSLVALDAATGAVLPFDAGLTAIGQVGGLGVGAASLYLSGSFPTAGGQPRTQFAAVDPVTGAVQAWAPASAESSNIGVSLFPFGSDTLYAAGGPVSLVSGSRSVMRFGPLPAPPGGTPAAPPPGATTPAPTAAPPATTPPAAKAARRAACAVRRPRRARGTTRVSCRLTLPRRKARTPFTATLRLGRRTIATLRGTTKGGTVTLRLRTSREVGKGSGSLKVVLRPRTGRRSTLSFTTRLR